MRMSKNRCYENPYIVSGDIQHTGIEEAPKEIFMIRLTERGKLITLSKELYPYKAVTSKRAESLQ